MNTKKLLVLTALAILVGINFYLYRSEFKVLIDPNDNIFQYALVDEARNIWRDIFAGKLSPFYLLDSWQERWAEGFALSNYYTHLPQAVIGLFGGYRLFVIIRTLMLILLPVMFYLAGTILRLPSAFNLILAFFSQAIFTDGLYGIDVSSFLWRGWGLSAQLMAVFFLPVAFAYAIDYFENKKNLGKAILFNFLVASSHFGIFSLILLGYGLYLLFKLFSEVNEEVSLDNIKYQISNIKKTYQKSKIRNFFDDAIIPFLKFIFLILFSLSYFIIPFFLQSQYRNFSVWDPIWKFDSWGARQVIIWFLKGDFFDFGRFPFITLSVIFGLFLGFMGYRSNRSNKNNGEEERFFSFLSMAFIFYTVLFLGRTTLGSLIDLIPGFSEYHQHRIVVMMQFTGIILGAWFTYRLLKNFQFTILNFQSIFNKIIFKLFKIKNFKLNENLKLKISNWTYITVGIFGLLLVYYLEQPLISYAKDNAVWIERSNKAYLQDLASYEKIKAKLANLPKARIYVGKPGNWGRQFTVGEVPVYMVLSQDGLPVIGFLPESWSPNSDPEQFFDEIKLEFYHLYKVGYSILPQDIKAPDFAKLIAKEGKYNLYKINASGWFDFGQSSIAVKSKKTNLLNITRLWFESELFKTSDYPKIDLSQNLPDGKRWYLKMTDKNNFINLNDGIERNIWRANPFDATISSRSLLKHTTVVEDQETVTNGYKASLRVNEGCQNCILVLKQSFHPNWEVRLNKEKVKTFPVFPFYLGVAIEKPGRYEIEAVYKPGFLKVILVWLEIFALGYILIRILVKKSLIRS